jgi:hypothetical protein
MGLLVLLTGLFSVVTVLLGHLVVLVLMGLQSSSLPSRSKGSVARLVLLFPSLAACSKPGQKVDLPSTIKF